MPDIDDGDSVEIQGSAALPYVLKNTGGVYSCTCPAWRNQSAPIERRTCKHLRGYRGEAEETLRVGSAAPPPRAVRKVTHPDGSVSESADAKPPPLLLAHSWEAHIDLKGWWMSEKLDGVRAYWDGEGFVSRLGNAYRAPKWFTQGLPKTPLDGELWCGRKLFQRTLSIVRRYDESDDWQQVRYLVFDAPSLDTPFEARLAEVRRALEAAQNPHAEHHPHELCEGIDHVKAELDRVESLGGEGLMMRKPGSRYQVGRSSTLLKVKRFRDAEARILDHLPGTGKHKGRLGALLVEMPDGTKFSVGTGFSDAEREQPPKRGEVITYRYQELSDGGVPRFPTYVGVRHDFDFDAARSQSTSESRPAAVGKPSARPAEAPRAVGPDQLADFESGPDLPTPTQARLSRTGTEVRSQVIERYESNVAARAAFEDAKRAIAAGGYRLR
ncbi:MAG: DNA ligase [Deltaproteobacteria bacterium]|nr:DNA ligase [Deltaproteobacteria bacterium]